jgi:hypothetical protein
MCRQSGGLASHSDSHRLEGDQWYSAPHYHANWHIRCSLSRWNGTIISVTQKLIFSKCFLTSLKCENIKKNGILFLSKGWILV